MHEMSLAEGVIQLLEEHAASQGFSRVKTVWLEIGHLAGVEIEALRFCFDAVCQGTLAEGATLKIIEIAGTGYCAGCRREVVMKALYDPCPNCGCYGLQATAGTGMRVKELEVVDEISE